MFLSSVRFCFTVFSLFPVIAAGSHQYGEPRRCSVKGKYLVRSDDGKCKLHSGKRRHPSPGACSEDVFESAARVNLAEAFVARTGPFYHFRFFAHPVGTGCALQGYPRGSLGLVLRSPVSRCFSLIDGSLWQTENMSCLVTCSAGSTGRSYLLLSLSLSPLAPSSCAFSAPNDKITRRI